MPDTHLILHIKGTESETAALPREEVRVAVGMGKISQSQLIWRPMENTWKPVRELPDLIPPVEHLILHIKGTEAETRQLPRPAVRDGISKGNISHSQLIWRPGENAWKQVREMPELLPSQQIAPAPEPARLRALPIIADEIVPEAPGGPVARAVAAAGSPPRVKMPGVATPTARPQARVATPVAVVVEAPVEVPRVLAVAPPSAVPKVRVAIAAEPEPHIRAVAAETPNAVPRVRVVPTSVAVPQVSIAPEPEEIEGPVVRVSEPVVVPQVRVVAVPTIVPPRTVARPVAVPRIREVAEPVVAEETVVEEAAPVFVPRVRAGAVPTVAQPREAAVPVAVEPISEIAEPVMIEEPAAPAPIPDDVPQVRSAAVPTIVQPRAVSVAFAVPETEVASVPTVEEPVAAIIVPQVRAVAKPSVPQPRAVPSPVAVPRVQSEAAPIAFNKPVVQAATPVAVVQVRAVVSPGVPQPRAAATPVVLAKVQAAAAPVAVKAGAQSARVREESTSHPLKALCIGLAVIIFLVVGANYLFVDRPLVSGIQKSEFSGASVYGHLAAFVQPNAIVIHIRPSKMIIEENFTKFLVVLAHCTPSNPISTASFGRVALTSEWTAQYSFAGEDWKQLADLENESEATRKEFLMAHLQDAGGESVMPETARTDEAEADQREKIWQKFVDSFVTKLP